MTPPSARADLRRRLQTAVRALELVAALADVAVQPGVVDRDRRPVGEDDGRLLVVLRELAARLLGQVEVAPDLAADDDRHAEEGAHRRMRQREPVRLGVRADVGQSQRLAVPDQHARARRARAAGRRSPGASPRRSPW